jgi:hypothetical protein
MRSRRLCPVPLAASSRPARVGPPVAEPGKLLIPASLLSLIQMFTDVSMFMSEKMPKNPGFCPAAAKNSPLLPPLAPRKSDISRQAQPPQTAGKTEEAAGETEEAAREECARLPEGTVPASWPSSEKERGCAASGGERPTRGGSSGWTQFDKDSANRFAGSLVGIHEPKQRRIEGINAGQTDQPLPSSEKKNGGEAKSRQRFRRRN